MNQIITDTLSIGATVAGSGVGVRLFVGAVKIAVKDIFPLLKKDSSGPHQCKYHESMSDVVEEFKKSRSEMVEEFRKFSEMLIRIEVRLEERLKDQLEMNKNIIELFDRLRKTETEIAVLKNGKIKI
jgi:predicted DNA-binding protein YlxM (UPF0122 family)